MPRIPIGLALFVIVGASCTPPVALPPSFEVTPERAGFVQLSRGADHIRLDLRDDIPGCLGERYDPTTGETFESGDTLRVLDVSDRGGRHYVLMLAIAEPNCNVQGRCGGAPSPNLNLIWIKVTPELVVEEKQTVIVEDCETGRFVDEVPDGWERQMQVPRDKLSITIRETTPDTGNAISRAEYDRQSPEAGIRVTASN